ncbi:hypothetical protein NQ317_012152 [Molorchus minor]|uniref:Uncharacterized protein n=1 Tax=Molorchus minor TaxID=1323400 RepID=A0ABQ9J3X0_9CUCU|nr:hypothetical protein NQ317_012152 [Molorchus minor]
MQSKKHADSATNITIVKKNSTDPRELKDNNSLSFKHGIAKRTSLCRLRRLTDTTCIRRSIALPVRRNRGGSMKMHISNFKSGMKQIKLRKISENVLLAYFAEKSEKVEVFHLMGNIFYVEINTRMSAKT